MVSNVLNQISGLNTYQKGLLVKALFKNPANRDVLVMLSRGTKSAEGTGSFANNGLATTVITNLRSRILISDLKLLHAALWKNKSNRAAFVSLFQTQLNTTDPGGV